jgi:hypothetical protein
MDAAMVLVDEDVVRVLYFQGGNVVGADSNVRSGAIDEEVARGILDLEQEVGIVVAAGLVPAEALRPALEHRAFEIATSLPFMNNAHFLVVDGVPDLGGLPLLSLSPMDLAMEGLRRYDEWRNRPGLSSASAPRDKVAPPAPTPRPARASAGSRSSLRGGLPRR